MSKYTLQHILDREMDRREFLQYVGVALLAIIGVNRVLSSLSPRDGVTMPTEGQRSDYGSSPYGR